MKPIVRLLVVSFALLYAAAYAQEPGPPDPAGEKPVVPTLPGAEDESALDAQVARTVLASTAVVVGRCTGVARSADPGGNRTDFVLSIRVEKVLKGVLDPVRSVAATIPGGSAKDHMEFMGSVFSDSPGAFVLFLDETDRFKTPPLFRMASPAGPVCLAAEIEKFVASQAKTAIAGLLSESAPERESAFSSLVGLGTPVLDMVDAARSTMSPESAEIARSVVIRITDKRIDPCRVVQPNAKYPHEPVDVYLTPDHKETAFKLVPGCTVFRLQTHSTTGRRSVKIRTVDGREGWMMQESCGETGK